LCIHYEIVGPAEVQFKKQKNTLKTSALLRLHSMFNVHLAHPVHGVSYKGTFFVCFITQSN